MNKRLSVIVPAAALAAGALLLTACGNKDAASTNSSASPDKVAAASIKDGIMEGVRRKTAGNTVSASGSDSEINPVNCGEVDLGTDTHHELIADSAPDGRVGCTEAFNVIDEFVTLPDDQLAAASTGYVELSNDWFCTIDDGETANVSCGKDDLGDEYGLTLHTEQQS